MTLIILAFTLPLHILGQTKRPEDFGFKHIKIPFQKDSVDILLLSKKGDEFKSKPLFLFCQGSLPIPLIICDGEANYPSFPFDSKTLLESYHLAILSKPGIPVIADVTALQHDFSYTESKSQLPPKKYSENNYLDYYVKRNLSVIEYFVKQKYINKDRLIAAGHSQGARIAFEMALKSKSITHLIYASGNPCGQIMSAISQSRQKENPFDTLNTAENDFRYYEAMVSDTMNSDYVSGDSFKSVYSFSKSSLNNFPKLNIPTFICYETLDPITPFNDLLRVEILNQRKTNFTFKAYAGLDHNYFGIKETGEIDYEKFNWDNVSADWLNWLNSN
jgi:dienelactone hydrolase